MLVFKTEQLDYQNVRRRERRIDQTSGGKNEFRILEKGFRRRVVLHNSRRSYSMGTAGSSGVYHRFEFYRPDGGYHCISTFNFGSHWGQTSLWGAAD